MLITTCSDVQTQNSNKTILTFSPNLIRLARNSTKDVGIQIINAKKLFSFYTEIEYDKDRISIDSIYIKNIPNHLFSQTLNNYNQNTIITDLEVDTSQGIARIGLTLHKDEFNGTSGDGILGRIVIHSHDNDPTSLLEFKDTQIFNYPIDEPPVANENYLKDNGQILLP